MCEIRFKKTGGRNIFLPPPYLLVVILLPLAEEQGGGRFGGRTDGDDGGASWETEEVVLVGATLVHLVLGRGRLHL